MTMRETEAKPTWGYYRKPGGWVAASPATALDELTRRRRGWTPLPRYGVFEMGTPYSASHPLEVLFLRGGAGELCDDQVRSLCTDWPKAPACGQALSPTHKHHDYTCINDARPVVFPQLEHITDIGPYECRFGCGRQLPTTEARDQHEGVVHKPEKSDERTGESLAAALLKGFGGKTATTEAPAAEAAGVDATMLGAILEKMEAMQQELVALKAAKPVRRRGPNKPKT